MTTFDRFERQIPSLMDELAPARVPDYLDDLLHAAARTPQRPWWSALERWLPMGVIARTSSAPRVPWRYLAIAVAVLALAAASLVYVGSHQRALPAPFGPARNGVIVYGTAAGDIASYDPVTGVTTTLIAGDAFETFPIISNDGTRLSFARTPPSGNVETDFTAALDGSNIRDFLPSGPTIGWWDESGSGDRVIVSRLTVGAQALSIVDFATGQETPIAVDPALGITIAMHRPGHDEIVYEHVSADGAPGTTVFIGPGDGTPHLRQVSISPDAASQARLSPDGKQLVYSSWGSVEPMQGRIHVIDIDTGTDTALMFEGSAGHVEANPQFSPDGRSILLTRLGDDGFRVTIVPADGVGPVTQIGPPYQAGVGAPDLLWAPDGTSILAGYPDGTVWMLPVDAGPMRALTEMAFDRGISWQRLAPEG